MSDYKLIPITELLSDIIDNRGKSCPTQESGFPLIATNCIKHSSIYPTFENIRYVSEETRNNWFRAELKPNDILFVNKGTPGRVCLVPDPITFCAAQDMVGLRANPDKIYYKYLFALLRSTFIQQKIANFHVGIAIPHFKKSDMDKLLIPVPDMKLQIKIGDMYCQLSEKIETNNRINAELESMAKTIYDYWFTQFDFPDENGKPYKFSGGKMVWNEELKREIPEGWGVGKLSDLCELINGRAYSQNELQDSGKYRILRVGNFFTNNSWYYSDMELEEDKYAIAGDLLYCWSASFGPSIWNYEKVIYHYHIWKVKCPEYNKLYVYELMKELTSQFVKSTHGSIMLHLTKDGMEKQTVLIPEHTVLQQFYNALSPIFEKIRINENENQQLASLRDWLLPMLMNGQVEFEEDKK